MVQEILQETRIALKLRSWFQSRQAYTELCHKNIDNL